ncbi:oligopeptide/dipeptide ABC transporter ATP-binding protein [Sinorhizobium meliloti]|uniref:oligopeptide/dipeptide ABC transporter ATP-binding protein n=1 Tax=Rhizobium meliloti TaxID=382 RepID=UPI003076C638
MPAESWIGPPNPANPPSGCHFRTRCPFAFDKCATVQPPLITIRAGHEAACHLAEPEKNLCCIRRRRKQ